MRCPHCGSGIPETQVFCRCMVRRYKGKHRAEVNLAFLRIGTIEGPRHSTPVRPGEPTYSEQRQALIRPRS